MAGQGGGVNAKQHTMLPRPLTWKQHLALDALARLCQEDQVAVITEALATPRRHSMTEVDVTPFRERYLMLHAREGLTAHTAAERLGWLYGNGSNGTPAKGDGTRLLRRLGLAAENSSRGYYTVRRFINYEMAVELCDALQLDYTEADV